MAFTASTEVHAEAGLGRVDGKAVKTRRSLVVPKNIRTKLAFAGLFSVAILSLGAAARVNGFSNGSSMNDGNNGHESAGTGSGTSQDASQADNSDSLQVNTRSSSASSSNESENHSSTTVTVNGQTESTGGNIDKTYQSDDGTTNVHVSVQNNSSTGDGQ